MNDYWDWKTFWQIIGILFVVGLVIVVVGFAFGWLTLPLEKGSAGNVETQFTTGYTDMKSLQALATTVCNFEAISAKTVGTDAQNQRQTQLLQYVANYNRIKGDYDAWAANVFLGKVVRPSDLPQVAPTLDEMKAQVCGK